MEFPLSYTFHYVCLYRAEPEALLKQYETRLLAEGARHVRRNGPVLAFDGAPLQRSGAWRYTPVQLFSEGLFEVQRQGTQTEIKANVSFTEAVFYLALASLLAVGVPGLFMEGPRLAVAILAGVGWVLMISALYWFGARELQNLVRQVEQGSWQNPTLR